MSSGYAKDKDGKLIKIDKNNDNNIDEDEANKVYSLDISNEILFASLLILKQITDF